MGKTKIKTIDATAEVQSPVKQEEINVQKIEEQVQKEIASKKAVNKNKQGFSKKRSKKYQEVVSKIEKEREYPLSEAVILAQKTSYSKFEGTVEAHINTTTGNIRGLVSLPYLSGKSLKVLAFGKNSENSGADIVGTDETIEEINKGKIDFDVVVATSEWMPKLARIARILGPRGLMPNPKAGTVTDNLEKAVADIKGGKVEYKTESKGQVIHMPIGKVNQPSEEIAANVRTLYNTVGRSKVKKITLSATMGPGVKVDISSI